MQPLTTLQDSWYNWLDEETEAFKDDIRKHFEVDPPDSPQEYPPVNSPENYSDYPEHKWCTVIACCGQRYCTRCKCCFEHCHCDPLYSSLYCDETMEDLCEATIPHISPVRDSTVRSPFKRPRLIRQDATVGCDRKREASGRQSSPSHGDRTEGTLHHKRPHKAGCADWDSWKLSGNETTGTNRS